MFQPWKSVIFLVAKGPAADATDAPRPQGFLCNPTMKMKIIIVCPFHSNGALVGWNWQGKTEVLGEKPVPVPLCPPQIPHRLTRDQTLASALGGQRLTAWAMAQPCRSLLLPNRNLILERGLLCFLMSKIQSRNYITETDTGCSGY
jgi:hypothetical protein